MESKLYCKVIYSKGSFNIIDYIDICEIEYVVCKIKNGYSVYIEEVREGTYKTFKTRSF